MKISVLGRFVLAAALSLTAVSGAVGTGVSSKASARAETIRIGTVDYEFSVYGDEATIIYVDTDRVNITFPSEVTIDRRMYIVTGIGSHVFSKDTEVVSITVPDSIVTIDDRAFYDLPSLKRVTLPDKMESIGRGVFEDCKNLTSVHFPCVLEKYGSGIFEGVDDVVVKFSCKTKVATAVTRGYSYYVYDKTGDYLYNPVVASYGEHKYDDGKIDGDKRVFTCELCGDEKTEPYYGVSAFWDGEIEKYRTMLPAYSFTYTMDQASVVPARVLQEAKAEKRKISVTGTDYSWVLNDLILNSPSGTVFSDLDLTADLIGTSVPSSVLSSLGNGARAVEFSLPGSLPGKLEFSYKFPAAFDASPVWVYSYDKSAGLKLISSQTIKDRTAPVMVESGTTALVYSFADPKTLTPQTKAGDVNGDGRVNVSDATEVLKHIAGRGTGINISAADLNNDGRVNIKDVTLILQLVVG